MKQCMARPILVGYDPRSRDRGPVSLGVMLARLTGAPLLVASVQKGHGPRAIAFAHEQVLPFGTVQPDDELLHDCAPQIEEVRIALEPYGIDADCLTLSGTSAASSLHEAAQENDAGL